MVQSPQGLYCPAADAWIDPWRPVPRALITHAHADHARPGSSRYWGEAGGAEVLRQRLGRSIELQEVRYGETFRLGDARVSFHPAGHVLGSAQIRLEAAGETWVVSGDYKRDPDPSCTPFEPVRCDVFITEATFGLPIYRWPGGPAVTAEIRDWWQGEPDRTSVLFCYAFGKAQRLLAELHDLGVEEEVLLHGAMVRLTEAYRNAGVAMVPTRPLSATGRTTPLSGRLVIAPPSAHRSVWMKRFRSPQTGFASGWMAVRGARRRRGYERGFVLSDHADWDGLVRSVLDSGAQQVFVTHGQEDVLARHLRETAGISAEPLNSGLERQIGNDIPGDHTPGDL